MVKYDGHFYTFFCFVLAEFTFTVPSLKCFLSIGRGRILCKMV